MEEMEKTLVIMGHLYHPSSVDDDMGFRFDASLYFLNSGTLNFLGITTLGTRQSSIGLIKQ